jgi:phospholipid/cholesterol/gamma-HCH transport system permease protein
MPQVSTSRPEFKVQVEGEKGKDITLSLSGRLALDNLGAFEPQMEAHLTQLAPARLTVDLAGLTYLDSAGALGLVELEQEAKDRGIPFSFARVSEETQRIMGLIDLEALTAPPLKEDEKPGFFEAVGVATLRILDDFFQVLTFIGDLIMALVHSFLYPRSVRWNEVGFYMKRAGVDAFPILGMMSLLLGLVMAFMSSLQLKQLGATVFVSALVGIAMVKELGPLLTAILVAGRSGSAFAAEIGTMMVNEEVDAITIMGFDPVKFLAVPKVLASILVVPLLTVYSMLIGIIGGLLVGVLLLDITLYTYINDTRRAIELFDFFSSLIKSAVFALIIAGIGCQRGFQVRGGAEAVGSQTTSAVVTGIFLIIVVDSMFAIALNYIR